MRQSAFFQTFRSILLRQGSASAIFALQKSLNAQRNKGISTARTRIVAFGLRKELKIFCRNPSPRPLVRPLTTLPVDKVGRFNFEPLELPANRRIFLTRYGDSLYFAPAHIVSVNRQQQPPVSRAEEAVTAVDVAPADTPPAPKDATLRPASAGSSLNRGPSAAYRGLCCAHLPSRAAGRAECLRVQRWALDLCTAANGTSPTCSA